MPLYFIRHGESQANKEGFLTGQMVVVIMSQGLEQAAAHGRDLKEFPVIIKVTVSFPPIARF